jgi:serine/threonine-protein kinase
MASSIWWRADDPNIYLNVGNRWYRYISTSSPVGEGAMGIVYLGFDCLTNEKVAIKMLRQEFWHDSQIRNRLKLEASLIINHPNIIRMIGFCEDETGRGPLYVLSEYVTGVTFKEHVEQLSYMESDRKQKFAKIAAEFMPVMDAVEHLHSMGVIHRDIKPSNLMFQDGYMLKLMDLGIAKADHFFDAHLKGFIGTTPYAAPEQVVSDDVEARVDNRTDIYALGVTLSYLLVGHFPVSSADKIPSGLENIIVKATAHSPEARYQHAYEMRNAISAYLDNRSARAKSPLTAVIVISLIALLAGLILFFVTQNL